MQSLRRTLLLAAAAAAVLCAAPHARVNAQEQVACPDIPDREQCVDFPVSQTYPPSDTGPTADALVLTWVYDDSTQSWSLAYDFSKASVVIDSQYLSLDTGEPEGTVATLPGYIPFDTLTPGVFGDVTVSQFTINRQYNPDGENPVYVVTVRYTDGFEPAKIRFLRASSYVDQCSGKTVDQCRSWDMTASYQPGQQPKGVERLTWSYDSATDLWTITGDPLMPSTPVYYKSFPDGNGDGPVQGLPGYTPTSALFQQPIIPRTDYINVIVDPVDGGQYKYYISPDVVGGDVPQAVVFNKQLASSGPGAATCPLNTPQQCLDHSPPPLGGNRPDLTGCFYSYAQQQCYGATQAPDQCQANHNNATGCAASGCFYDSAVNACFASLAQSNSIFSCSYWSSIVDSNGDNAPCAAHGCAYESISRTCSPVTQEGSNNSTDLVTEYSTKVTFENPTVLANSNTFELDVVVPFVYTDATSVHPAWPVIMFLQPMAFNFGQITKSNDSPQCSTYSPALNPTSPGQFSSTVPATSVNAYLQQLVSSTQTLNFDNRTAVGQVLELSLGHARIGGNNTIVRAVTYDGANLRYKISVDLTNAVRLCGDGADSNVDRGLRVEQTTNGNRYTVPVSYIEQRPNEFFTQASSLITIDITLTGTVSISATAQYHRKYFAKAVSFDPTDCASGSARMVVSSRLQVFDIFDSTKVLTFTGGQASAPNGFAAPSNCYGDEFLPTAPYSDCDPTKFTCWLDFTTRSQCRVLTPDGLAFSRCDRGPDNQRITDLGSDVPYPASLENLHRIYGDVKICDLGTDGNPTNCKSASQTTNPSLKDQYQLSVASSAYLGQSTAANPFTVVGGLLPTPTSGVGAFRQLSGGPVDAQGFPVSDPTIDGFNGNVFSNQPLTALVLLPVELRTTYDLRVLIRANESRIYPLDGQGKQIGVQVPQAGFAGPLELNYGQIARRTVYATKNDFDNGCGYAQTCAKLPACLNLLGCDGFSVPVPQLRALMNANGYRFRVDYRIGLTNADGSPPNARLGSSASRRLLSLPGPDTAALDVPLDSKSRAVMRRLLQTSPAPAGASQYTGTFYFNVIQGPNGTQTVVLDSSTGTQVTVTFNQSQLEYHYTRSQALNMTWPWFVLVAIYYPFRAWRRFRSLKRR